MLNFEDIEEKEQRFFERKHIAIHNLIRFILRSEQLGVSKRETCLDLIAMAMTLCFEDYDVTDDAKEEIESVCKDAWKLAVEFYEFLSEEIELLKELEFDT